MRHVLVGAEATLTVVLLSCGALLLSGFDRTARIDPGFDPQHVLGAQIRLPQAVYATEAARTDVVGRILARVRSVPGVVSASTTFNLFVPGFAFVTLVHVEGQPSPDGQAHTVHFRRVSPDYFTTLRIPLLRGRDLGVADGAEAPRAVVVSRQFAEKFWPDQDPIGRRIRRNQAVNQPIRWLTIVGVVGDVSDVGFAQWP